MKRVITLLFSVGVAALSHAQTNPAAEAAAATHLTFQEALNRALQVNNTVESSRAEIQVAEANRSFLLSAVMPKITLNGNAQRNSIEKSFGSGGDQVAILPRNNWAYQLTMSQPLFAGRRELRAYSQAKIGVENARISSFGTEDAVLLRVSSSYLAVVNADRRVEIEQRNIALAEKRLTQAKAFYEAGEVTKVDVFRAETAQKAAQRQLAAASQAREHAVAQLREDLDLDGPVEVAPPEHALPAIPSESELTTRAESTRPDVQVAENNVRSAKLEIQKQKGFWLPTVTFDGGLINQKSPFPASNYVFGRVNFSVPIFQSGEVLARVAGAKAREKEAELALDSAKISAREDVRTALADVHSAEQSLQLAQEQLSAAEAEYNQAFELYRAQEATSLDVAASETSLADARRAVAEETLNRDLAELRVWYAAGSMKEAVGVSK